MQYWTVIPGTNVSPESSREFAVMLTDSLRAGLTKISRNVLEHGIMYGSRCSRELAESGDVIANIRATRDVGVHELPKKGVV